MDVRRGKSSRVNARLLDIYNRDGNNAPVLGWTARFSWLIEIRQRSSTAREVTVHLWSSSR
jgi:hypothetical protein